jgi:GTP-binding protein
MLKIRNVEYFTSYVEDADLPDSKETEIAFVGRSNVGKSSLINDLCGKRIAKTSSTPGKTRMLNYFKVNSSFFFVDLPGYGYAAVSKSMKKDWARHIESYLQTRTQLKGIFFLLDIRRKPNEEDKLLNEWFKKTTDISVFYILTKADKLSAQQANKQKISIALELFIDQNDLILYSTTKRTGKTDVLKKMQLLFD